MAMNMEEWNELYPPGTEVLWTPVDAEMGAEPIETKTTGKATQPARLAMVRIAGYPQPVWLHRVKPVVEGPARMTIEDLEAYLLLEHDMEKGQDPVALAIATIEKMAKREAKNWVG